VIRLLARTLAVLVTAGLLYAMQRTTPGYSEITGPIVQNAGFDTVAAARGFRLRVEKVVLAEKLRWKAFGRSYERDSGGLWAVVVATVEAGPGAAAIHGAIWQSASGLRFRASPRASQFRSQLDGNRLEPGLARRGLLIFEIGRDEARGAALLISQARFPRLDSQLRIALPDDRIEQADTLDLDAMP
jgi:hypothetical protein